MTITKRLANILVKSCLTLWLLAMLSAITFAEAGGMRQEIVVTQLRWF